MHGTISVLRQARGPWEFLEFPLPDPEPGAILVRVSYANVCGSDLHGWRGDWVLPEGGRAMGHEMAGRVAALGAGVATDSTGQSLKEGDRISFGTLTLEVLHTPGHTPGGVCFVSHPYCIFSGDTLFQGSIGRTDLWGGDYKQILRSIQGVLLPFPDETPVFPGHGEPTTIGEERQSNPFLRGL